MNKRARFRNRVQLIGDVESVKQSGNKKEVVFKMTTEPMVGDFKYIHTAIAVDKTAEFVNNYVARGNRVAVEGMLNGEGHVLVHEIMLLTQKQ